MLTLLSSDPTSNEFKILLIASEIGVTLIIFFGFYLIFNKFNKKFKQHRSDNPALNKTKKNKIKDPLEPQKDTDISS